MGITKTSFFLAFPLLVLKLFFCWWDLTFGFLSVSGNNSREWHFTRDFFLSFLAILLAEFGQMFLGNILFLFKVCFTHGLRNVLIFLVDLDTSLQTKAWLDKFVISASACFLLTSFTSMFLSTSCLLFTALVLMLPGLVSTIGFNSLFFRNWSTILFSLWPLRSHLHLCYDNVNEQS